MPSSTSPVPSLLRSLSLPSPFLLLLLLSLSLPSPFLLLLLLSLSLPSPFLLLLLLSWLLLPLLPAADGFRPVPLASWTVPPARAAPVAARTHGTHDEADRPEWCSGLPLRRMPG